MGIDTASVSNQLAFRPEQPSSRNQSVQYATPFRSQWTVHFRISKKNTEIETKGVQGKMTVLQRLWAQLLRIVVQVWQVVGRAVDAVDFRIIGRVATVVCLVGVLLYPQDGYAQTMIEWIGGGGTKSWTNPANWQGGNVPDNVSEGALFPAGSPVTVINVPTTTIGKLLVDVGAQVTLVSTGTLTVGNGGSGVDVIVAGGGELTLNMDIQVNSPDQFQVLASGVLKFAGSKQVTGTGTFILDPGGHLYISATQVTGALGNINTNTITLASDGHYYFTGAGQNTSGLPATIQGSMTVQSGSDVTLATSYNVNGGIIHVYGTIIFDASNIFSGAGGTFNLYPGATLRTANPQGISSSSNTGSVQTGARNFDGAAHYVYNGASGQISGDGLPTAISGSLTVDVNGDWQLSTSPTITGDFIVADANANVDVDDETLTLSGDVTITSGAEFTASTADAGSIIVNGSGTITGQFDFIAGSILNTFQLDRNVNITASNLAIGTTGTLALNQGTLAIGSPLTLYGTTLTCSAGGKLRGSSSAWVEVLPGAAGDVYLNFDAGYQTLHHITVNRPGQTVHLCSDLTLVSSATQFVAGTFNLNGNHLTIQNSGGIFSFDVANADFAGSASSDLTIGISSTSGATSIDFAAAAATIGTLTLNLNGGNGSLTVTGAALSVTNCNVTANSFTFGLGDGFQMTLHNTWTIWDNAQIATNASQITYGPTSTLWYRGTTQRTSTPELENAATNAPYNLFVSNSGGVTLSANLTGGKSINGSFTVSAGYLDLNSYDLTLNGPITLSVAQPFMGDPASDLTIANAGAISGTFAFQGDQNLGNFAMNRAGEIATVATVTVNGTLLNAAGTVHIAPNHALTIATGGTVTNTGGNYKGSETSSLHIYAATISGDFNFVGQHLKNLTVSSASQIVTVNTLTLATSGTLTLNDGTLKIKGGETLHIYGIISTSGTGFFGGTPTSTLIDYLGGPAIYSFGFDPALNNLGVLEFRNHFNNGVTVTLDNAVNIYTRAVVEEKGSGSVTLNGANNLNFQNNTDFYIINDPTINGTPTYGSGVDLWYQGTAAHTTGAEWGADPNGNVYVANSGGVTLGGNATLVSGTVFVTSGTGNLDLNNNNLELGAGGTLAETTGSVVVNTGGNTTATVHATSLTINATLDTPGPAGLGIDFGNSTLVGPIEVDLIPVSTTLSVSPLTTSIVRIYKVSTGQTGIVEKVRISYLSDHLNSLDPTTLVFYTSSDGINWTERHSIDLTRGSAGAYSYVEGTLTGLFASPMFFTLGTPGPAYSLAYSVTSATGTEGFNGGVTTGIVSGQPVTVTVGTFSLGGNLVATNATTTLTFSYSGPEAPNFRFKVGSSLQTTQDVTLYAGAASTTNSIIIEYIGTSAQATTVTVVVSNPSLVATSITIQVTPTPARHLAFSTTASTATNGFNGGNLTVNENSPVPVTIGTFSAEGYLRSTNADVTITLTSSDPAVTLRANGGVFGSSTTMTIVANTFSSTANVEFDYTGVAPSVVITLTASAAGNVLTATSINVTVVGKPASIIAYSTTSTTGTDGVPSGTVNSGVAFTVTNGTFSVDGDLRETTANLTVNYSVTGPFMIYAGAVGTIYANTAVTNHSITVVYTGTGTAAVATTLTATAASIGSTTQATITVQPDPAVRLAYSTTSSTGVDGFKGGSLSADEGVAFPVTVGSWSAFGHLRATTANTTVNLTVDVAGVSIVPNTIALNAGATHTSGNFTLNYSGAENDPFNVIVTAASAVYPYSTNVTVNFDPKEPTKLAFSVDNGNTSATSGFNGGNLTVTEGTAVPVTVSSFSPDDWFRQTSANVDVTISVNAGVQVRQSGGVWGSSTTAQLAINTYQVSSNLEFRYFGTPANTVATVTASAPGYPVSTTISITINGPAVRLAYSSTSSFGTDGFDAYPNPIMEDQPFTVTTGSFSMFGELRSTTADAVIAFTYGPSAAISAGFSATPASTTLTAGNNYVEATMTFGYTGPATMGTVTVTASSAGNYPYATTLTVPFYAKPATNLAWDDTSPNERDGLPASAISGTPFTITAATFSPDADLRATSANTVINITSSYPGVTVSPNSFVFQKDDPDAITTLSVTLTYTESASTTVTLTLSGTGLASTQATITVYSYPSKLKVTSVTPATIYNRQTFNVNVISVNSADVQVPVPVDTDIELSWNHPALTKFSGSTAATIAANTSAATITLALDNASNTDVTTTFTVSTTSGHSLSSTTTTITIKAAPIKLAFTSITTQVIRNQPFSFDFETWNSANLKTGVTAATVVGVTSNTGVTIVGTTLANLAVGNSSGTISNIKLTYVGNTSTVATLTLAVQSGPALAITSVNITVLPYDPNALANGVARYGFKTASPSVTNATAGAVLTRNGVDPVEVQCLDTFGNVILSYNGDVYITIGSDGSACPGDPNTVLKDYSTTATGTIIKAAVNGVATFATLHIDVGDIDGVPYTLYAYHPSNLIAPTTSTQFLIFSSTATGIAFWSQPPASTSAGLVFSGMKATCATGATIENTGTNLVVQLVDQYGNPTSGVTTVVELSIYSQSATPGNPDNVTGYFVTTGTLTTSTLSVIMDAGSGRATFANVRIDRAGIYRLKAYAGLTYGSAISNAFEITPTTASTLRFVSQPTTSAIGNVVQGTNASYGNVVAVEALDQWGNRVTNQNIVVNLTTTAALTLINNSVGTGTTGIAIFNTMRIINGAPGTYQLKATSGSTSLLTGFAVYSDPFILEGAADRLAFSTTSPTGIDGFNGGNTTVTGLVPFPVNFGLFNNAGTLTATTANTTVALSLTITDPGLSLYGTGGPGSTTATVVAQYTATGTTQATISWTGSTNTTATLTLSVISAGTALQSTSVTLTIEPNKPADRLAFSTSAVGTVNPYDQSGVKASTPQISRKPFMVYFQTLNPDLYPTATTATNTQVQFSVVGSGGNPVPGLTLVSPTSPITLSNTNTLYSTAVTIAWDPSVCNQNTTATLILSVSSGGSLLETRATVSLKPFDNVATQLDFIQDPNNITAGGNLGTVKVAVKDAYGNVRCDFVGTVNISVVTSSSLLAACNDGVLSGTLSQPVVNGVATFNDLSMTRAGTYYLRAEDNAAVLTPATSALFTVSPASAVKLAFYSQPPSVTTAGYVFSNMEARCTNNNALIENTGTNLVVQFQDQYGNLNPAVNGNVTLSINTYTPNVAGLYSSSGTISTVLSQGGIATFANVRLLKAGVYTLRASVGGLISDAISNSFTVVPDVPAYLSFIQQPTDNYCEGVFSPAPVVAVWDQWDNRATNANITEIYMYSTTPSMTILPPTTASFNTGDATGTFTNLRVNAPWGYYQLEARITNPSLFVTSASFLLSTSPIVSAASFTVQPTTSCTGETMAPFEVTLYDNCTNVSTTNGSVYASASGGALLNGSSQISVNAVNGVAVFSGVTFTAPLAGYYTITATHANILGATISTTSNAFLVDVNRIAYTSTPPSSCTVDNLVFEVGFYDACNNPLASTGTVYITITGAGGYGPVVFSGSTVASVNAKVSVSLNATTSGWYTAVATFANVAGTVLTTTATFYINVESIAYNAAPSTSCVGPSTLSFGVDFLDACGQLVNTSGTVTVTTVGPSYSRTETFGVTATNHIVGALNFSGVTAGTYTATATYPDLFGNTLTTSASFTIDVFNVAISAGPAGCPTGECGTSTLNFTVDVFDFCNNPIVTTSDVRIQIMGPGYNQTFTIANGISNATQGTVSVAFSTATAGTYTAYAAVQNLSGMWISSPAWTFVVDVQSIAYGDVPSSSCTMSSLNFDVNFYDGCDDPIETTGTVTLAITGPSYSQTVSHNFASVTTTTVPVSFSGSTSGIYTAVANFTNSCGTPFTTTTTFYVNVESIAFNPAPSTTCVGTPTMLPFTVDFKDYCGNPINTSGTLQVQITGPSYNAVQTFPVNNASSRSGNFNFAGMTAGTYTVTARYADLFGNTLTTTSSFTINVNQIAYNAAPSTSCVGPSTLSFGVDFLDACGQLVNTSGTVTVTTVGPSYSRTETFGVTATNHIVGALNFSGVTAGTYTATATYPDLFGNTLTTSASFTIDVFNVAISAGPAGCPTGECGTSTLNFTVDVFDFCNNPIVTTSDVRIQIMGPGYNQTFTIANGISNATQGTVSVAFSTATAGTYTAYAAVQNLSGMWISSPAWTFVVDVQSIAYGDVPSSSCTMSSLNFDVNFYDGCDDPIETTGTVTLAITGPSYSQTVSHNFASVTTTTVPVSFSGSTSGIYTAVANFTNSCGTPFTTTTTFYVNVESIAFNPAPSTTCVGTPTMLPFTVDFKDYCGNPINTSGTLQVQITGPSYNAVQTFPVNNASSRSGNFNFAGMTAGTYTVTARYADLFGNILTTTSSFIVDAVSLDPSITAVTTSCGYQLPNFTVTFRDACGNAVGTNGTVTLITPAGVTLVPNSTDANIHTGIANFNNVTVYGPVGTYTVTAQAVSVTGATIVGTFTLTITPGDPYALKFQTQPGDGEAGNLSIGGQLSVLPVVQVIDQCGNDVSVAGATISLTLNPVSGVLHTDPALPVFSDANGEATWTGMAVEKVGTYTLTASGTYGTTLLQSTTSTAFVITHTDAYKVAFVVQPPTTVGSMSVMSPDPVVEVQDFFGNRVTTGIYASTTVTITLQGGTPGATLYTNHPGNQVTTVDGQAAVTGVRVDKVGTGYWLVASASPLQPGNSDAFDVVVGPPAKLAFRAPYDATPQTFTGGQTFSPDIEVEVQDLGGNLVTTATHSITLSIASGPAGGTLTVAANPVNAVGGVATFAGVSLDKVGTYKLQVDAAGLAPATSANINIVTGPPVGLAFNTIPDGVAGEQYGTFPHPPIEVRIVDAGGNTVSTAASWITVDIWQFIPNLFSASGTPQPFTGTDTKYTASGVAQFNLTFYTAGQYILRATSATYGSTTSNVFTINPADADPTTSTVSATNTSIQVGDSEPLVITFRDPYGNLTTTGGPISVSLTGFGTILPVTSVSPAGSTTQTITPGYIAGTDLAGQPSSTATVCVVGGSSCVVFTVYPGDASGPQSTIVADGSTSIIVGTATTATVYFRDQFGNPTTTGNLDLTLAGFGSVVPDPVAPNMPMAWPTMATVTYTAGTNLGGNLSSTAIVGILGGPSIVYTVYPDDADPTTSTIVADGSTSIKAGESTTATVYFRDQYGNATTTGSITLDLASFGSFAPNPVSPAAGATKATVTYTAGTNLAGNQSSTATLFIVGNIGQPNHQVVFTVYPNDADPAQSFITADGSTSIIVGTATTATVWFYDQYGNPTTTGSLNLDLVGFGSVAPNPVTPNMPMAWPTMATVTYTAGTNLAGNTSSTATVGISGGSSSVTFTIYPDVASQNTSTIAASTTEVVVGTSVDLTVSFFDQYGNPSTSGNINLSIAPAGYGTLSVNPVPAAGNTQATIQYTAPNVRVNPTVTIALDPNGGQPGASVTLNIRADFPTTTASFVTATPNVLVADGVSSSTLKLTLIDQYGNQLNDGDVTYHGLNTSRVQIIRSGGPAPGTLGSTVYNGDGTFGNTFVAGTVAGSYVVIGATIDGTSIIPANHAYITLIPGPASPTTSTVSPSAVTLVADGASTTAIIVTLYDDFGNQLNTGGDNVEIFIASGLGTLDDGTPGATAGVSTTASYIGNGQYRAVYTAPTSTGATIVRARVNGSLITTLGASTCTITNIAGPASTATSVVSGAPATLVVGTQTGDITIQMFDKFGNPTTNGTVTVQIIQGGGSLQPTSTGFTGSGSLITMTGVTTGTFRYTGGTNASIDAIIHVTLPSGHIQNSPIVIDLIPDVADHTTSTVTGMPATVVVGQTTPPITITMRDRFGNLTTNGTVTISQTGGDGTLSITTFTGGVSASTTFTYTAGTNATLDPTISVQIGGQDIVGSPFFIDQIPDVADPTTSTVTGMPSTVVVGQTTPPITVTMRDQYGNITDNGTVTISQTGGDGTLNPTSIVGMSPATFTYTAGTDATQDPTVSVQIGGTDIVGSPFFIDQIPDVPAQLRFIQNPTDTRSGDQFSPTVTVEVLDQYGNRNTTNVVTVNLSSSGSSFLTGNTSVNSVLGIATFTGVGICGTAGAGYALTATSAGLTATTSTLFSILIGDPVGLAFTTQPGQVGPNIAGQPIVQQPVVAIVDCGGNTVPTTAIVKLEINTAPDPGLVGQLVSITTAVNGVASFNGVSFTKAGTYTLRAQTVGTPILPAVVSDPFVVTNASASQLAFSVNPPTETSATSTFDVEVQVQDQYGNLVPNYTTTVTLSLTAISGTGVLSADYTVTTGTGTIPFTNVNVNRPGQYYLEAAATGLNPGISTVFNVVPGPAVAAQSTITPTTATVPVGGFTTDFVVVKRDANGNLTTVGTVSVNVQTDNSGGGSTTVIDNGTTAIIRYTSGNNAGTDVYQFYAHITSPADDSDIADLVSITQTPAVPVVANVKAVLEGPFDQSSGALMHNLLNQYGFLPTTDPYGLGENVALVPANAVDWVVVELRDKNNFNVTTATRAAFITTTGTITDLDGSSQVAFSSITADDYYIVIKHRNHLWIMSSSATTLNTGSSTLYDFTVSQSKAYSQGQLPMVGLPRLAPSVYGMVGGDAASTFGIINAADRVAVRNASGQTGYLVTDVTLDGIVNAADRIVPRNNAFRVTQVP